MHWNSPGCFEAGAAPDEISTIAGSLGAIFRLLDEDVAGIKDRSVKVSGNMEGWQTAHELRRVMTTLNATLRD